MLKKKKKLEKDGWFCSNKQNKELQSKLDEATSRNLQ